jgi:general secretion pathway protein A
MYEKFYGLRERPFDLTPNPAYLFMTPKHREALATLQYGLSQRKGFTVVIGEAGTGKTTLVNAALQAQRGNRPLGRDCVAYLNNPTLSPAEFIAYLAPALGLSREAASSKASFLIELTRTVTDRHQAGGLTALIVDEAQNLPDQLLEEIRLLANVETGSDKLLQIVLTGQPELADRLNQTSLRQLKQRIALRCVLNPLDKTETGAYIAARVWMASSSDLQLFTQEAVDVIYEASRGIPRTISVTRARTQGGVHEAADQTGSAGRRQRYGPPAHADGEAVARAGRGNAAGGSHAGFISSLSRAPVITLTRTLTRSDLG